MNYQVESILQPKERSVCLAKGYRVSDKFLGGGAVGRVFLAEPTEELVESSDKLKLLERKDGQLKVAIKIVYADVGAVGVERLAKYIPAEISNLNKAFGHPNIIKLLDVFVSCKRIFMVMEYAARGDLKAFYRDHVACNPDAPYMGEVPAHHYFTKILAGVQHLHQKGIAHRDLKLENILVTEEGEVKLADLGFSVAPTPEQEDRWSVFGRFQGRVSVSQCGTPGFMAPEVLRRASLGFANAGYNAVQADLWSLGVVLFVLVNGHYPFPGKSPKDVLKQYEKVKFTSLNFRKGLSQECQDLISRLISHNPMTRPTVAEILSHPWITQEARKHPNVPSDKSLSHTVEARRIGSHQKYVLQSTYVNNYLDQRKELLKESRKVVLKSSKVKPEDLRNAGIRIQLPRQDTGGKSVDEVWRFEAGPDRKSKEIPSPLQEDHSPESLSSLISVPQPLNPTLGITTVKHVIPEVPLLEKWRTIRQRKTTPKTELEKCVRLCNTVDLDPGRSWPPSDPIPRPPTQQWVEVFGDESKYPGKHSRISDRGNTMILKPVPQEFFNSKDILVVHNPEEAELARENSTPPISPMERSRSLTRPFTFYLSPIHSSLDESGRPKSRIPVHSSRKELENLQEKKRKERMRRATLPSCAFYVPRGVKPKPPPKITPIDLSRVLHRKNRGVTKIPFPKQTLLHVMYPPNRKAPVKAAEVPVSKPIPKKDSLIPVHSSRKIVDAYKKKIAKEEMRRRTLPRCAFYKVRGVEPKPRPKIVLKQMDVRKCLQRKRRSNIPVPNCIGEARRKLVDLYFSRKLQKDKPKKIGRRLRKPSQKALKKKRMVDWCKAKLFPTLFPVMSDDSKKTFVKPVKKAVKPKPVQFILNWKSLSKLAAQEKKESLSVKFVRKHSPSSTSRSQMQSTHGNVQAIHPTPHRLHIHRRKTGVKATNHQLNVALQQPNKSKHQITGPLAKVEPKRTRINIVARNVTNKATEEKLRPADNKAIGIERKVKTLQSAVSAKVRPAQKEKSMDKVQKHIKRSSLSNTQVAVEEVSETRQSSVSGKGKENRPGSINERVARLNGMSWRSLLDSDVLETDLSASMTGPDADKLQVIKKWMGDEDFYFFRLREFADHVDNLVELSDCDPNSCGDATDRSKSVASELSVKVDDLCPEKSYLSDWIPLTTGTDSIDVDRIVNEMLGEESPLPCLNSPRFIAVEAEQTLEPVKSGTEVFSESDFSDPRGEQNFERSILHDAIQSALRQRDSGATDPYQRTPELPNDTEFVFAEIDRMLGFDALLPQYLEQSELPTVEVEDESDGDVILDDEVLLDQLHLEQNNKLVPSSSSKDQQLQSASASATHITAPEPRTDLRDLQTTDKCQSERVSPMGVEKAASIPELQTQTGTESVVSDTVVNPTLTDNAYNLNAPDYSQIHQGFGQALMDSTKMDTKEEGLALPGHIRSNKLTEAPSSCSLSSTVENATLAKKTNNIAAAPAKSRRPRRYAAKRHTTVLLNDTDSEKDTSIVKATETPRVADISDDKRSKTAFIGATQYNVVSATFEETSTKRNQGFITFMINVPVKEDSSVDRKQLASEMGLNLTEMLSKLGTSTSETSRNKPVVRNKAKQVGFTATNGGSKSAQKRGVKSVSSQTRATESIGPNKTVSTSTDFKSTQTFATECKSIQTISCESTATQTCDDETKSTQTVDLNSASTQTCLSKDLRISIPEPSKEGDAHGNADNAPRFRSTPRLPSYHKATRQGANVILPDDCWQSSFDSSIFSDVEGPTNDVSRPKENDLRERSRRNAEVALKCTADRNHAAIKGATVNGLAASTRNPKQYGQRQSMPRPDSCVATKFVPVPPSNPSHQRKPYCHPLVDADSDTFVPLVGARVYRSSSSEAVDADNLQATEAQHSDQGDMCMLPESKSLPKYSHEEMRDFIARMRRAQHHVAQRYGRPTRGNSPRNDNPRSYRERMRRVDPNNEFGSHIISPRPRSHEKIKVYQAASSCSSKLFR